MSSRSASHRRSLAGRSVVVVADHRSLVAGCRGPVASYPGLVVGRSSVVASRAGLFVLVGCQEALRPVPL